MCYEKFTELPVNALQGYLWNGVPQMLFVSFQLKLRELCELNQRVDEEVHEANTELCTPLGAE